MEIHHNKCILSLDYKKKGTTKILITRKEFKKITKDSENYIEIFEYNIK